MISSCHADRASRGQRARAPTVHANSVPSSSRGGGEPGWQQRGSPGSPTIPCLGSWATSRGDGAGVEGQVRPGVCLVKLGGIRIAAPRRLVLGTVSVSVTRMAEGCVGVGGFAVRNGSAPCQATVDDSTTKLAISNRGGAILGRNQQPQAACKSRQLSPGPGNKTPTSPPADDLSAARPLLGRRLREKSRPRTETASRRRVPPPRPALTARVAGGPLCLRDKFPGRLRVTVGLLPGRYVGPGKTSGLHRERQYPIMNSCGPAQVLTTWTTGLYRSEGGRPRWAI